MSFVQRDTRMTITEEPGLEGQVFCQVSYVLHQEIHVSQTFTVLRGTQEGQRLCQTTNDG